MATVKSEFNIIQDDKEVGTFQPGNRNLRDEGRYRVWKILSLTD